MIENTFSLARMKDPLKNSISLDQKATSIRISIWKKKKETVSPSRNNVFFLNVDLPLITVMVSKKMWMKEYRFHKTENLLPLAVVKDSFKLYFREMEKLLPMEEIFEILEQNGFH